MFAGLQEGDERAEDDDEHHRNTEEDNVRITRIDSHTPLLYNDVLC